MKTNIFGVSVLSVSLLFSAATLTQPTPDYARLIEQAHQKYKGNHEGKIADYIPAVATYRPNNFAITIATVDGKIYQVGDVKKAFPMESLSKVFTMVLAEMAIAGLYGGSSKGLCSVGTPAKSSGGMVAVVPEQYAIAVYSPPLDATGNSIRVPQTIDYVAPYDASQSLFSALSQYRRALTLIRLTNHAFLQAR